MQNMDNEKMFLLRLICILGMFTDTYGNAIQGNEQSDSVAEQLEENSQ
jgi:hypothetical protein